MKAEKINNLINITYAKEAFELRAQNKKLLALLTRFQEEWDCDEETKALLREALEGGKQVSDTQINLLRERKAALALLNQYLSGRVYTNLNDAIRQMLQVLVTTQGNLHDLEQQCAKLEADTQISLAMLRELIAMWRINQKRCEAMASGMNWQNRAGLTFRDCADQLEAAVEASLPEPQPTIAERIIPGLRNMTPIESESLAAYHKTLFTPVAPPVEVKSHSDDDALS